MAKRWHVLGYRGYDETFDEWAPGTLSVRQIVQLLVRLHCRHLTDSEVLASTLESRDRERTDFMVIPINAGRGGYMTTGSSDHYTARYEEADAHGT